MKRVISAIVMLVIFIAAVLFKNPWPFNILVMVVSCLGIFEFFNLAKAKGIECSRVLGVVLCVLLQGFFVCLSHFAWEVPGSLFGPMFILLLCVLIHSLASRKPIESALPAAGATLLGLLYVGFLGAHFILLRKAENIGYIYTAEVRAYLIFFVCCVVWGGDTAAYYIGKNFGKHKMAPSVSPKKTMEGALANLLASLAMALLGRLIFWKQFSISDALLFGLVLNIASQVGDLVESKFKRSAGVKDTSNLIPGHGGVLDRLDSLLFAGPAFYYLWWYWPW